MRKLLHSKKGFTLVELMVVVIIVGILAAVAVPLYRANLNRAASSEGVALLGSIRTAQRVYYAEHDTYTASWADLGGNAADLADNKYFQAAPAIASASATTFTATVTSSVGMTGIVVAIDQDGTITVTLP